MTRERTGELTTSVRRARAAAPSSLGLRLSLLYAVVLFASPAAAQTPQESDATRNLWDTAFVNAGRARAAKRGAVKRPPARRRYRVATPAVPPVEVAGDSVIGVTIWRLLPASSSGGGERLIVHEGAEEAAWVPERVASDSAFREGDRLRVSVETARLGFLYVIDRERYADGSLGDPYLIFPTTRTIGGDNKVSAGRLVEIPAREDVPPFFTLKRSRRDQVGEVLTIIVSPLPLEGLVIGNAAQRLTDAQVAAWEKSWGSNVGRLEMEAGAPKTWTRAEREAGADQTRALAADAPAPQTLFYRAGAKAGEPVLAKVSLRYGTPAAGARRAGSKR